MILGLLSLILGLCVGFYARKVYDMLLDIYQDFTERREAQSAGVVRVSRNKVTRAEPLDMSTSSGVVMRPSPLQAGLLERSELANEKERNAKIKRL